jgi:hypothetical protein
MPSTEQTVRIYEDLAYLYDRQGQAKLRDWFLVLAADTAFLAGWEDEAERLRVQLLSYNPHHLLKPFTSFTEAVKSPDIQSYIADLKHSYPPERAEELLHSQKPAAASMGGMEVRGQSQQQSSLGSNLGGGSVPKDKPKLFPFQSGAAVETKPAPAPARTPPPKKETKPAAQPAAPPMTSSPPKSRPAETPARKLMPNQDWAGPKRPAPQKSQPLTTPQYGMADENTEVSRWVSGILFVLVALAGVALAGYTLLRPFIPEEWLP